MAFQNYLCWDTGRVRQVLNTDAEYASRHIFLAVHSEFPLRATNPRPEKELAEERPTGPCNPRSFSKHFCPRTRRTCRLRSRGTPARVNPISSVG